MTIDIFAQRVRRLRSQAGLTLRELGERAGISVSALSNIETGKVSPTYERIVALAQGLDVDVGCLFGDENVKQPMCRRSITLKGEGIRHSTPQYVYEALCADIIDKQFVPLIATIKARSKADFDSLIRHEGEEFLYVLVGQVTVYTDQYSPMVLREGDSCYWDSTMGHACVSSGESDAKVIWVSSNPRLESRRAKPPGTARDHLVHRDSD